MARSKETDRLIAKNRTALHDYFIEDTYEAGISLSGTEVKSLRAGKVNLKDSYCYVKNGEVYISNMHISPYEHGNVYNLDPLRDRKLLLHTREIRRLREASQKDGYTLVPLDLHFSRSYVKVSLGVGKGKKLYDKRDDQARKDMKRDIDRAMKNQ
ncbi:MAG: SsrA-binding protein SmpB [Eubacteriaceae bacterium]|nr:SsrA-binding protein SmpB [Eubacteriaceae bacterium]MBR6487390.1 SsrA-binding protein SmpB [Clostridiales bacterium]